MAYELFCDSFDTDTFSTTTGSFARRNWTFTFNVGGLTQTRAAVGRRGTQALYMDSGYSAYASLSMPLSTHVVVGFWLTFIPGHGMDFSFRRSGSIHANINISGSRQVTFRTASNVNHVAANQLSPGDYVEFGVVIGDSGSFEMRVNGSSTGWFELSGVDTRALTLNQADSFFITTARAQLTIDDFYATYGDELKWLGDIRVDAIPINANATPQDWTPDEGEAYQRLTQAAGYIQSATVGAESLFELADYAVNTVAIHGVAVSARALKSDAGIRSFAIETKSGDTVSVGATQALGTSSQEFRQTWLTDPNTGAAWTGEALNALKAGVKLVE